MRRPVQRRNQDTTTSACVGWDLANIENRLEFRKEAAPRNIGDKALQNGFTTTKITAPIIKMVGTSLINR
jgi:hypothetical protein